MEMLWRYSRRGLGSLSIVLHRILSVAKSKTCSYSLVKRQMNQRLLSWLLCEILCQFFWFKIISLQYFVLESVEDQATCKLERRLKGIIWREQGYICKQNCTESTSQLLWLVVVSEFVRQFRREWIKHPTYFIYPALSWNVGWLYMRLPTTKWANLN